MVLLASMIVIASAFALGLVHRNVWSGCAANERRRSHVLGVKISSSSR